MKSTEAYITEIRKLKLDEVVGYNRFSEYAITAHSTQIEGATLTEKEASLLIDEGITPKGKPLEHALMVTDHHKALQLALDFGATNVRIEPKLINTINAQVMASTGMIYRTVLGDIDASKGELRKGQVYVAKRYFPNYQKVAKLLANMCEDINEQLDQTNKIDAQLLLSYRAHFDLVGIHPHYDGNGRTSRLLMNMIQRRYNLPLAIVHNEDKLEYYEALENSKKFDSIDPFYEFMDEQYKKHLSSEIEKYHKQVE